jgi:hypothetical protein
MKIGIDGNQWYCSNGLCLGDIRAQFTFADTLREASDSCRAEFGCTDEMPPELTPYLDMTSAEYINAVYGVSQ